MSCVSWMLNTNHLILKLKKYNNMLSGAHAEPTKKRDT